MANPINNNNPALINPNTANKAQERNHGAAAQNGAQAGSQAVDAVSQQGGDAVSVSRAAEVLNQAPAERAEGSVQTSSQATELAQRIRAMFADNPDQGMSAQAKNVSGELTALLGQA